jgi:hypothetical protein
VESIQISEYMDSSTPIEMGRLQHPHIESIEMTHWKRVLCTLSLVKVESFKLSPLLLIIAKPRNLFVIDLSQEVRL